MMNYPLWVIDNQLVYHANWNTNMLGRYVYEVQISTFAFTDFSIIEFTVELIIKPEEEEETEDESKADYEGFSTDF